MTRPALLLTRRGFILSTAFGLVGLPLFLRHRFSWFNHEERFFLTSLSRGESDARIAAVGLDGKVRFELPVGSRCHGIALDPARPHRAVVFPKRPGYLAYLVNFAAGQVVKEFPCSPGRFFYGHGSFSSDGKTLYASENDYEKGRGVITIRDGETLSLLGELPSFGIGPHDMSLLPDGKTLIVANGGLLERPEVGGGREALNIDSMEPSVAYIDLMSQKLLGEFRLADRYLGMRHLAVSSHGTVAVAIQSEAPQGQASPLLAFQKFGGSLELAKAPEEILIKMKNFGLSVCMEPSSGITALTCPKGNLVTLWDSHSGTFLRAVPFDDASGLALSSDARHFVVTSGTGKMMLLPVKNSEHEQIVTVDGVKWDNHLSSSLLI